MIKMAESVRIGFGKNDSFDVLTISSTGMRREVKINCDSTVDVLDAPFDARKVHATVVLSTQIIQSIIKNIAPTAKSDDIGVSVDPSEGIRFEFLLKRHELLNANATTERNQEDANPNLKTYIFIDKNDIEEFHTAEKCSEWQLAFGVKEIKSLLLFCEQSDVKIITLKIGLAKEPVQFSFDLNGSFAASLTIASFEENSDNQSQNSEEIQTPIINRLPSNGENNCLPNTIDADHGLDWTLVDKAVEAHKSKTPAKTTRKKKNRECESLNAATLPTHESSFEAERGEPLLNNSDINHVIRTDTEETFYPVSFDLSSEKRKRRK